MLKSKTIKVTMRYLICIRMVTVNQISYKRWPGGREIRNRRNAEEAMK